MDEPQRDRLRHLASNAGVSDLVVWTGWVPMSTAWGYVQRCEVGLSPIPRSELLDVSSPTKIIEFLAFDPENPNSIVSCLRYARENARTVRDSLSSHMWEEINKFYHLVRNAAQNDEQQREGSRISEQRQHYCERVVAPKAYDEHDHDRLAG